MNLLPIPTTGIVRCLTAALVAFALASTAAAQSTMPHGEDGLPAWVADVGALSRPTATEVFSANEYGAVGDGETTSTEAIQAAIDAAAEAGGGIVTFQPGTYLTGAIFVKSNVHLRVDEGVTLLGTQSESAYPVLWTRVAGIEMEWPAALINVYDSDNVMISGGGTIDGNGEVWWDKYWTMRHNDYEPRGLRWAVDYDAARVRLMVVWESSDVTIENLDLRRSGFWTVQIVYSERVTVDGVTVRDNGGPSTDGVNVDSSSWVLVQNCDIDNNDDCICLKAGRDADGLRVNRPTEYVVVRDNLTRRGGGIVSFGSETSGDIRNVVALNNRGIGTQEGIRFKSARTRGGVVEDVLVRGVRMENVPIVVSFNSNWNPSYSYATLPEDMKNIPEHWIVMNEPVRPERRGWPEFRNITIEGIEATGADRFIAAQGLETAPLHGIHLEDISVQTRAAGSIRHARDWTMRNVSVTTADGAGVDLRDSENVELPDILTRTQTDSPIRPL